METILNNYTTILDIGGVILIVLSGVMFSLVKTPKSTKSLKKVRKGESRESGLLIKNIFNI